MQLMLLSLAALALWATYAALRYGVKRAVASLRERHCSRDDVIDELIEANRAVWCKEGEESMDRMDHRRSSVGAKRYAARFRQMKSRTNEGARVVGINVRRAI